MRIGRWVPLVVALVTPQVFAQTAPISQFSLGTAFPERRQICVATGLHRVTTSGWTETFAQHGPGGNVVIRSFCGK